MEWEGSCVVLDARPFGEGDAVVTVLAAGQGLFRGLARGGSARARAATWQPGTVVAGRWVARLSDQLGSLTGEPVHQPAALLMDDPLGLSILAAACAVAAGALPEREPQDRVLAGLIRLCAQPDPASAVRWEAALLGELGYGLDLAACAVSGATEGLAWVSPRTGRAVADAAAGTWRERLLPLPTFLIDRFEGEPSGWRDGLRLTGHFLARDAFGAHHRPLPPARVALYERVAALAEAGHGG